MTSQDYIKVEHVRNWLLSSSLAKFQQFWSECFFFQVLFSLFLAVYEGLIQLLYLGKVHSTGLFGLGLKFFLFFSLKSSNGFHVETQIFRRSFIFCYFCLLPWGFDFAPARGSPASVSDHAMTSQDYIKVNTSGLDFLALVLQSSNSFDLNVLFFKFCLVYFSLFTKAIFNCCI